MAWLCARTVLQTCRRRISYSLACAKDCKYHSQDNSRRIVRSTHFRVIHLRNVFRSSIDFDFRSTANVLRMVENEKNISINSHVRSFFFLTVADPLDHATGLEKREMLAHLAGNDVSCDVSSLASTSIFLWLCCTSDIIISHIITII